MLSEDSQTTLNDSYSGTLNPSLGEVIARVGEVLSKIEKKFDVSDFWLLWPSIAFFGLWFVELF